MSQTWSPSVSKQTDSSSLETLLNLDPLLVRTRTIDSVEQ